MGLGDECEKKDTTPIVPTIALDTADKSPGNNKTPTIIGKAEVGSTVTIKNGSTILGSTTTPSNGNFSIKTTTLADGTYSLTATATDNSGNTSNPSNPLSITIDSTKCLIQGPSGNAGALTSTKSISENLTAVHTFTANETVSWSLIGGADKDLFKIDSSTGALSFHSVPDYENPGDTDTNNSYIVIVRATDSGGNTSDQTVTIRVIDVASTWTQVGNDIDGESEYDYSGGSVSLSADGSVVAIGATGDGVNDLSSGRGHVRIFKNVSGTWTQVGNDIDGEATGDKSGGSVSLSEDGSVVAIGATGNEFSGHVRIFKNVSGTWTQVGNDIDSEATGDNSGVSVSLSNDGSLVAIGATGNDGVNGNNSGHVRIFKNVSGTWTQVGNDIDGESEGDKSGRSVSLSSDGSVVAIGAINNKGNGTISGHVRIFQNISGTWTQVGNDIDGEGEYDTSGFSVSLNADGSVVAIGATGNDGVKGAYSGRVKIFQNVSGTWTQVGNNIDGEAKYDSSGHSVSLSADGSVVAIGAYTNDGVNGYNSGHVRIFKNVSGTWTQVGNDIDGESVNDYSGGSVSLSADGSIVAIGATNNMGGTVEGDVHAGTALATGNAYSGHVRIYKFEQ